MAVAFGLKRPAPFNDEDLNATGREVITISDTDSEKEKSQSSSELRPLKRLKSDTSAERSLNSSRDNSTSAKTRHRSRSPPRIVPQSRTKQANGIQSHGVPVQRPQSQKSVAQTIIIDLEADPTPSPPRTEPTSRPSHKVRNDVPRSPPGSPLFDRVKDARDAHMYRSPFDGSNEDDNRKRTKYSRDITPSRSSAIPSRPRSAINGSQSSVQRRSPTRYSEPAKILKRPAPSQFSLEITRPTPSTKKSIGSSQEVDRRPQPVVVIEQAQDILRQFQGPRPESKVIREAERKEVWSQLRQSTKLAHENPDLVKQHFGQTGFSKEFNTEGKEERLFMGKVASKKKKKEVDRTDLTLEIQDLSRSMENLKLNKRLIHPSRTAQAILTNQFDTVNPPLTFSNDINSKRLHGKFQFVSQYIIGDKVRPAPPSTNKGCGCTDCSLSSCLCFTKKVQDDRGSYNAQMMTYTRRADGIVVLSDEYLTRELDPTLWGNEITECNEFCRCGPGCWNRVVGNGRTVPLELFQTMKCGFGVRSSHNIVRGQFIELYLGEVITEEELCRREAAVSEDDPSYILQLDWFERINQTAHHVDGKYFGSAMRFVNHSCEPNARCFVVQVHKADRKIYYLAFFAIRDIKAGVEIRIDYDSKNALPGSSEDDRYQPGQSHDGQLSEDLVKCYCGEKNCRGILWTPGVKARQRRRRKL